MCTRPGAQARARADNKIEPFPASVRTPLRVYNPTHQAFHPLAEMPRESQARPRLFRQICWGRVGFHSGSPFVELGRIDSNLIVPAKLRLA
jgi:hypothetical protein